jgi:F-type H+-transporting ATPase subunit b
VLSWLPILAAAAEGGEAVAEADPPNPVLPEWNEAFWALVFFLALWAAMKYVLLPPLRKVMAEREEVVRRDREAADRSRDELIQAQADYEAALAGARAEANQLIEEARARADARRNELDVAAEAEIAALRQQATAELGAARQQAISQMTNDVTDLAVSAASAVIGAPVDRARATAVVERIIAERRN